jgi:AcrR family transcriptional regulator
VGEGAGEGMEQRAMRADALANRQRILDAAEAVFTSEGLSVPVDVVAAKAGVGIGTLYRHFPTKEALFEAIVATKLDELVAKVREVLAAPPQVDPAEALFDVVRTIGHQSSQKHDLYDALGAAGIDLKSRCAESVDEVKGSVEELLRRAQDAGEVRRDVTGHEVVDLVVAACSVARPGEPGLTADRLISVVCDGLRTVASSGARPQAAAR